MAAKKKSAMHELIYKKHGKVPASEGRAIKKLTKAAMKDSAKGKVRLKKKKTKKKN